MGNKVIANSEALAEYVVALTRFIGNVKEEQEKLKRVHNSAGRAWHDALYENFGAFLNVLNKSIDCELKSLSEIKEDVKNKAISLREAEDIERILKGKIGKI